MKKLLFIASKTSKELERFMLATQDLQWQPEVVLVADTFFEVTDKVVQYPPALTECSAVMMRLDSNTTSTSLNLGGHIRQILLQTVPHLMTKTLNGSSYSSYPEFTKLQQLLILAQAGVPVPNSHYTQNWQNAVLPIVLKKLNGSNGEHVHYVETSQQLAELAERYGTGQFLLQQPLPIGQDYRVIVLGDQAIACHKKISQSGFLTNVSAGGRVEPAEPERVPQLFKLAVQAAQAVKCEYAGVDVMYDQAGQPQVLEVNRGAGFNAAQEEIWGIDLAQEVIKYLTETRSA